MQLGCSVLSSTMNMVGIGNHRTFNDIAGSRAQHWSLSSNFLNRFTVSARNSPKKVATAR